MDRVSPEDLAELTACGLYDPDVAWAADRLEALELLIARGATLRDLRDAGDELGALAGRLALRPGGNQMTLSELAERSGLPLDVVAKVWRASGFPDPSPDAPVANESDVLTFRGYTDAGAFFGEDAVLHLTRVIGGSMTRLAETLVSFFLVNVAPAAVADPSGLQMVRANLDSTSLLPQLLGVMDRLLRNHMAAATRPMRPGSSATGFEVQDLTVGFLDLVDSTALTRELPFAQLAQAIGDFEERAGDTVVDHGGRVVKLIGDAVMFTTPSAAEACAIAIDVRAAVRRHPVLAGLRGGLAAGEVLLRDGDCFGPVVHLAARLVQEAGADELIVDGAVTRALDDGPGAVGVEPLGSRPLKGFDGPVAIGRLVAAPEARR